MLLFTLHCASDQYFSESYKLRWRNRLQHRWEWPARPLNRSNTYTGSKSIERFRHVVRLGFVKESRDVENTEDESWREKAKEQSSRAKSYTRSSKYKGGPRNSTPLQVLGVPACHRCELCVGCSYECSRPPPSRSTTMARHTSGILLSLCISVLILLPSVFSHMIEVPAAKKECFFEDLHKNDKAWLPWYHVQHTP